VPFTLLACELYYQRCTARTHWVVVLSVLLQVSAAICLALYLNRQALPGKRTCDTGCRQGNDHRGLVSRAAAYARDEARSSAVCGQNIERLEDNKPTRQAVAQSLEGYIRMLVAYLSSRWRAINAQVSCDLHVKWRACASAQRGNSATAPAEDGEFSTSHQHARLDA
jgi:hypothetical protein